MAKLHWSPWPRPERGYWLRVEMLYEHGALTATGLREDMLIPIQKWSEENNCGRRMSFDLWQFRNEKEVTMFLLKWN